MNRFIDEVQTDILTRFKDMACARIVLRDRKAMLINFDNVFDFCAKVHGLDDPDLRQAGVRAQFQTFGAQQGSERVAHCWRVIHWARDRATQELNCDAAIPDILGFGLDEVRAPDKVCHKRVRG